MKTKVVKDGEQSEKEEKIRNDEEKGGENVGIGQLHMDKGSCEEAWGEEEEGRNVENEKKN